MKSHPQQQKPEQAHGAGSSKAARPPFFFKKISFGNFQSK